MKSDAVILIANPWNGPKVPREKVLEAEKDFDIIRAYLSCDKHLDQT